MVGIVIVAHGELAKALLETACMIVGPVDRCEACTFAQDKSADGLRKMLRDAIKKVDVGEGVMILTDMFGGTPSNISLSFLEQDRVEVVTGVNLPMVIYALTKREGKKLRELAQILKNSACSNISVASEILSAPPKE